MREHGSYLTSAEKHRRYDALRALLKSAECAAAIVVGTPHGGGNRYFRYFTDWPIQSIGGYLVVDASGGEQAVFRASSQAFWARTVDWVKDIVSAPHPGQHVIERLREVPGKIGLVGREYFPVGDYQAFEAAFSKKALIDLTPQIDELQAIKSGIGCLTGRAPA